MTEGSAKGSRHGGIRWAQESFDQGRIAALALELLADRVAAAGVDSAAVRCTTEWPARNQELSAAASARAEAAQHKKPLDKTWVARGLEQFRDANTVILHEIEPGHLPIRARQTRHLVR